MYSKHKYLRVPPKYGGRTIHREATLGNRKTTREGIRVCVVILLASIVSSLSSNGHSM